VSPSAYSDEDREADQQPGGTAPSKSAGISATTEKPPMRTPQARTNTPLRVNTKYA
jgi:hypothetical protein